MCSRLYSFAFAYYLNNKIRSYLYQKLKSPFAEVVRGCMPYKMYQIVAHSSAPVNCGERFNTHSQ